MPSNTILSQQIYDTKYIYDKYKETLSELIAYIEVYEHDLPTEVMAQIAELFQSVAVYENRINSTEDGDLSNLLLESNLKITQSLYKHAICLFIKKIEEYKRMFKRFQYKGVMLNGKNFAEVVKRKEKEIIKSFSEKLKKCYKKDFLTTLRSLSVRECVSYLAGYIKVSVVPSFFSLKKEPFLPINSTILEGIEEVDLANIFIYTKELLELYESILPKVISNGAKQSFKMSMFVAILGWVIPIVGVIPIIIEIIKIVRDFGWN